VFVTALPTIAQMVGTNRILRGVSITHPAGDPALAPAQEHDLRLRILRRSLEMLAIEVAPTTIWELEG
jgi:glycine/betaine/sarcosine/D-proline reductase family selenoprotein B